MPWLPELRGTDLPEGRTWGDGPPGTVLLRGQDPWQRIQELGPLLCISAQVSHGPNPFTDPRPLPWLGGSRPGCLVHREVELSASTWEDRKLKTGLRHPAPLLPCPAAISGMVSAPTDLGGWSG